MSKLRAPSLRVFDRSLKIKTSLTKLVLGNLGDLTSDPLKFLLKMATASPGIAKFRLAHKPAFLLSHPDYVHEVFGRQRTNFVRKDMYSKLIPILGNGLLTSDETDWKVQRRILQPIFAPKNLSNFEGIIKAEMSRYLGSFASAGQAEKSCDLVDEFMQMTLRIIFGCVFGDSVSQAVPWSSFVEINRIVGKRLWHFTALQEWLPERDNVMFFVHRRRVNAMMADAYARKVSAAQDDRHEFLGALVRARDPETGLGLSQQEIMDQIITFMFAGHETTAISLSWALIHLLAHPEWMARVCQELQQCGDVGAVSRESEMPVIEAVIKEAMRLNPPAWILPRTTVNDCQLGPERVKAGSLVFTSPYVMHLLPSFWQNPETFDPGRFLASDSGEKPETPAAFMPFGAGMHSCIGKGFALMEAKIILSQFIHSLDVHRLDDRPVGSEPDVTLRPKGQVMVKISRRADARRLGRCSA